MPLLEKRGKGGHDAHHQESELAQALLPCPPLRSHPLKHRRRPLPPTANNRASETGGGLEQGQSATVRWGFAAATHVFGWRGSHEKSSECRGSIMVRAAFAAWLAHSPYLQKAPQVGSLHVRTRQKATQARHCGVPVVFREHDKETCPAGSNARIKGLSRACWHAKSKKRFKGNRQPAVLGLITPVFV